MLNEGERPTARHYTILAMSWAGGLLCYLSFGVVADWRGRRVAYTLYSLLWAVGLLSVTWFWGMLVAVPTLTLAFMFLVGVGTGNFSGYGPIFSELFPVSVTEWFGSAGRSQTTNNRAEVAAQNQPKLATATVRDFATLRRSSLIRSIACRVSASR